MASQSIEQITVLGSGNMGHGIAEVTAMAGYNVTMRDIEQSFVNKGYENIKWSLERLEEAGHLDEPTSNILTRISSSVDLEAAVEDADLVIEAVPEKMDLKKEVFADLDEFAPKDAILASNTSSLSISEMGSATSRPDKVVGLHFFNPPVKMDLVEVISGEETSDATGEAAYEFVKTIDKTPIYVRRDIHRFVVNNVLGPFLDEPHWMVSWNEATVRQADAAMTAYRGYPMGPFELIDMTGIDVSYHVRQAADITVSPLMEQKIEAEEFGQKTGKGHYDYERGDGVDYEPNDARGFDTLRVEALIINEAVRLVGNDVATPDAVDTGMRLGTGFPEGPCRRADQIGLDVILEKLETLYAEHDDARYAPDPYLIDLVEAGETGVQTGSGLHEYDA
jgi:enoyl-CoA hydratase / 3-hydroxyacyl-CoA dehydrogenase